MVIFIISYFICVLLMRNLLHAKEETRTWIYVLSLIPGITQLLTAAIIVFMILLLVVMAIINEITDLRQNGLRNLWNWYSKPVHNEYIL